MARVPSRVVVRAFILHGPSDPTNPNIKGLWA